MHSNVFGWSLNTVPSDTYTRSMSRGSATSAGSTETSEVTRGRHGPVITTGPASGPRPGSNAAVVARRFSAVETGAASKFSRPHGRPSRFAVAETRPSKYAESRRSDACARRHSTESGVESVSPLPNGGLPATGNGSAEFASGLVASHDVRMARGDDLLRPVEPRPDAAHFAALGALVMPEGGAGIAGARSGVASVAGGGRPFCSRT